MATSTDKRQYTAVNKIYNVDIVEKLEDADPTHYALILDEGRSAVIDVPLINVIKIYLEHPRTTENGVTTVQLSLPEGIELSK